MIEAVQISWSFASSGSLLSDTVIQYLVLVSKAAGPRTWGTMAHSGNQIFQIEWGVCRTSWTVVPTGY